ncbi:hypothetical protein Tco_1357954, partial [Tanacetum coccineum]
MEILPESTSNSSAVGDLRDSIRIKLVSTGYQFGPVNELMTQSERSSCALRWKPCQGDSLNLPDHSDKDILLASRFKNQESLRNKDKTSAKSDIKDNSLETKLQRRLLESFQEDAKYEH